MKITYWLKKFLDASITAIELQLFLLLISWPLLLWWEIPVSTATLIGNLIMTPFLMVQLALCSIMAFCALCNIPLYYSAVCFEFITALWKRLLLVIQQPPLIIGPCPPWYMLFGIISVTLMLLFYLEKRHYRIAAYVLLIAGIYLLLLVQRPSQIIQKYMIGTRPVLILHYKNKSLIIDSGRPRSFTRTMQTLKHILQMHGSAPTVITLRATPGVAKLYDALQREHLIATHLKT